MKKAIFFMFILFSISINTIAQKSDLYICDARWNISLSYDELKTNYFKIGKVNCTNFFTMLDSIIHLEDTLIQKVEYPIKEPNIDELHSVIIKQNDKEFIVYKIKYFSYNGKMYYLNKSIYLMYMNYIPLDYWKHATPIYFGSHLMHYRSYGKGMSELSKYHPRYCSKFKQWRNKCKRKKLHW
jgi:hypothetical protein